jgi:hypothetical protein
MFETEASGGCHSRRQEVKAARGETWRDDETGRQKPKKLRGRAWYLISLKRCLTN